MKALLFLFLIAFGLVGFCGLLYLAVHLIFNWKMNWDFDRFKDNSKWANREHTKLK